MSGYTPLFSTLTNGSLCGKWPDIGLWPIVLSLADRNGVVDKHPTYIAAITGLSEPEVTECMARFCEPDAHSRTAEDDGRRLRLLDPSLPWGWVVVNHTKYREKARKASFDARRAADGRNRERMRTREDPRGPAISREDPPSKLQTQTQTVRGKSRATALPSDFQLDADLEDYAKAANLDPRAEFDHFRDHHTAKGTTFRDWSAAFRTWCRNSVKFNRGSHAQASKPVGAPARIAAAIAAKRGQG